MNVYTKRGHSGGIPEKLKVFAKEPVEQQMYVGVVHATPVMVVDAKSKSETNARYWTLGNVGGVVARADDVTFDLRDNDPIPYLKLVGLDLRAEGGRAWKVLTPENHLVDLREDAMLNQIFTKGIPSDGVLEGPFRWVKLGSSMRLALMDSPLYKDLEKLEALRRLPRGGKLRIKDLVVGGIYRGTYAHRLAIYRGRMVYRGKKLLAWEEMSGSDSKTPEESYAKTVEMRRQPSNYGPPEITCTGSCSYTTKVGQVTLEPLPPKTHFRDGFYGWMNSPVTWL